MSNHYDGSTRSQRVQSSLHHLYNNAIIILSKSVHAARCSAAAAFLNLDLCNSTPEIDPKLVPNRYFAVTKYFVWSMVSVLVSLQTCSHCISKADVASSRRRILGTHWHATQKEFLSGKNNRISRVPAIYTILQQRGATTQTHLLSLTIYRDSA